MLSPYYRASDGYARVFSLVSNGFFNRSYVYNTIGVRPVISLKHGVEITSGTGTATSPWEVTYTPATISSISTMQDFGVLSSDQKQEVMDSMTTGTAYDITDSRDNQTYKISKLADGKVWLLDNLRLGATALNEALSTSNTNMSSSVAFTLPKSSSANNSQYETAQINTAYASNTVTSYGLGSGKVGVYYNYCATTAGTYCYASGFGTGDATYDICPVGWRLPTGGPNSEYSALFATYNNSYADFKNALSTPLSGYLFGSSASGQGVNGLFWSATYYNPSSIYRLNISSSSVNAQTDYTYRYEMYSIRCILK